MALLSETASQCMEGFGMRGSLWIITLGFFFVRGLREDLDGPDFGGGKMASLAVNDEKSKTPTKDFTLFIISIKPIGTYESEDGKRRIAEVAWRFAKGDISAGDRKSLFYSSSGSSSNPIMGGTWTPFRGWSMDGIFAKYQRETCPSLWTHWSPALATAYKLFERFGSTDGNPSLPFLDTFPLQFVLVSKVLHDSLPAGESYWSKEESKQLREELSALAASGTTITEEDLKRTDASLNHVIEKEAITVENADVAVISYSCQQDGITKYPRLNGLAKEKCPCKKH